MQICTTLTQTHNHASIPPLSFLQAGCPSCCPTNSIKALNLCLIIPVNSTLPPSYQCKNHIICNVDTLIQVIFIWLITKTPPPPECSNFNSLLTIRHLLELRGGHLSLVSSQHCIYMVCTLHFLVAVMNKLIDWLIKHILTESTTESLFMQSLS